MSKITANELLDIIIAVVDKNSMSDAAFRTLISTLVKNVTKSTSSYSSSC